MKIRTCMAISAITVFVAASLLMEIQFPWSTYSTFGFSKWLILRSYMTAAVITALAAAVASALCLTLIKGILVLKAATCFLTMFVLLAILSVLFGPGGFEVPGTLMGGFFFSELEFLNFIFMVAAPASLVAAALCAWLAHKQSTSKTQSSN